MLSQTSRAMKPKLSLSINTAATSATSASTRPSLALKSPSALTTTSSSSHSYLRSPISPSPVSPTARNTRLNQRGYSTMQQPSYAYVNGSAARSILKKHSAASSAVSAGSAGRSSVGSVGRRQCSFDDQPMVYCVTPIESGEEYYGSSVRVGRDERRWGARR